MGEEPATAPQGTRPLQRRYYEDELTLVKALQRRAAAGADVLVELARLGTVFAGPRGHRRSYTPREAKCLAWPETDISPHHYRDDVEIIPVSGEEQRARSTSRSGRNACPGGCGELVPKGQMCSGCASERARVWKAGRRPGLSSSRGVEL